MTINVDWLNDEAIEAEANYHLNNYQRAFAISGTMQTPVEEIIEVHFSLPLEIKEMREEVLGYLDIGNNIICVNKSLDPDEAPSSQGRFNYTLAHEVGHHVLHRGYVENAQQPLFDVSHGENRQIICRKSEAKARIEVQADMFASYFLMPKQKVIRAFTMFNGHDRPLNVERYANVVRRSQDFLTNVLRYRASIPVDDEDVLKEAFKPLADQFGVSKQAFYYRLRKLGLLVTTAELSARPTMRLFHA